MDCVTLGFYTCGFGCMSCIGNSGPIMPALHDVADNLELASVLSGNRNFEGRISPDVSQNYLGAPATVDRLLAGWHHGRGSGPTPCWASAPTARR